jgi:undecaprenyl-diphosphatase
MAHADAKALLAHLRAFIAHERILVAAVLLLVASAWVFIEVLDEIIEDDEAEEIDVWVMETLHRGPDQTVPIGPDWLVSAALDLTALGGPAVLTLMVALVAGYLALRRDFRNMWLVLIASVLGVTLNTLLKAVIGRERPPEAIRLAHETTASFPSGHSALSAIIYLTLGAILAASRTRRRERTYIIATALLLTGIVGVTRVYIGVHYPTDVLAGWSAGLCWTLVCLIVAHKLQRPRPAPAA